MTQLTRLLTTCAALALFQLSPTTHAAGFDCKLASSTAERLICTSPVLSELDEQLTLVYQFELRRDKPEALRASQKAWMRERERCTQAICLTAAYEQRIKVLCDEGQHVTGAAIGVSACTSVRLSIAERELERLERSAHKAQLSDADNPAEMKSLLDAERSTWRAHRNAKCALHGAQEGGVPAWQAAYADVCILDETRARAAALKKQRS